MEIARLIAELWPVFAGILFCVIWLIRLEAKVLYLEQDKDDHWKTLEEMQRKMDLIASSLARIEGKLSNE